jgi:hypothetical protein
MVIGAAACWSLLALAQAPPGAGEGSAVKALRQEAYPWYEPRTDSLKPVQPPWTPTWWDWIPEIRLPSGSRSKYGVPRLGNLLVVVILVAALAVLISGLVWAYRHYMPAWDEPRPAGGRVSTEALIGGLPPGLPTGLTDPLGLARSLRAQGDLAGAILALFVHQAMTLDRLRLTRLVPGRTARQLVRSVADSWVRARVEPTLGLFESSFYGHRDPEPTAFESAWALAEELEARVAEGAFA